MAATKAVLTIGEQIDRAREGRSQTYIVGKLRERGIEIDESKFSRMKNGHETFTEEILNALSEILGSKFILS